MLRFLKHCIKLATMLFIQEIIMTEDKLNEVHKLKELISKQVHELVDRMCTYCDEDVEQLIRTQLNDEFRFWKRPPNSK